MADPPPTRLHIAPPIDHWQVTPRNGRTKPVIATGHQPYLWHPGILAKDLAADAFAQHVGGSTLHVVVEHNALDLLSLELPLQFGDRLITQRVMLDNRSAAVATPPNRLPPLDPSRVAEMLFARTNESAVDSVRDGLRRLASVYERLPDTEHLSAQTTAVLNAIKQPWMKDPITIMPTSALVTQAFWDRVLDDPVGCARSYNKAVAAYPEAGIRPLEVKHDIVEAPVWAQADAGPTRVYLSLADSSYTQALNSDASIDLEGHDAVRYLRPRAITLSAIMRSEHCDLFIHGIGGGVYDQVTERWWQDWTGEDLAPKAVVTADMYLPFDSPTATRDERIRAQWFAHHLPHNVDRYTETSDGRESHLRQEKRNLLDHMSDDRDKRRRAKAFERIHAINAELAGLHDEALSKANQQAKDTRIGVSNARIARRRDWCFALYPEASLQGLSGEINSRLPALPG